MTYILGVNCTDGVVLIGDRKIIYNDTVDWQQKIFGLPVENIWFASRKYYPVGAIGSAGSVFLGQKLRDEPASSFLRTTSNLMCEPLWKR